MKRIYVLLVSVFALLFSTVAFSEATVTTEKANTEQEVVQLAGADYWRQVKDGQEGYTTAQHREAGVLINTSGQLWREIRNKWITPIGALMIGASFVSLFAFYLWAGQIKVDKPKTGKKILRWTPFERALHWYTAILFIILGFSGLTLLYGKHVMKPMLSDGIWANLIMAAKVSHNYLGPLFVIGIAVMLVKWLKNNFFTKVDLEWFKAGGGILPNGKHPSADFCNGGEKVWFWLLATAGVAVCISGLVMDFPMFGQLREHMQIANIIHAVASLGLIAASFGHIYIGTVGTEGALDGMKTGYVDESWAKQHHNLWYDRVKDKAE